MDGCPHAGDHSGASDDFSPPPLRNPGPETRGPHDRSVQESPGPLRDSLYRGWASLRDAFWPRQDLGLRGEQVAARFLRRKGFRILTRRLRNPFGEIDLIALERQTIVFVEVKTWRSQTEDPAIAVDAEKQRRLTNAALAFLKQHQLLEHAARFDVVSIRWPEGRRSPHVRHFINAFPPVGTGQWFS